MEGGDAAADTEMAFDDPNQPMSAATPEKKVTLEVPKSPAKNSDNKSEASATQSMQMAAEL